MRKHLRSICVALGFLATYILFYDKVESLISTRMHLVGLLVMGYAIAFIMPTGKTKFKRFTWIFTIYLLTTFLYLFFSSFAEGFMPNGVIGNLSGMFVFFLAGSPVIVLLLSPAIIFTFIFTYKEL